MENQSKILTINAIKIIWTISLASLILTSGIMFSWKYTRRSADDLVKIMPDQISAREKADICIKGGGRPDFYAGGRVDCLKN